MGFQHCEAEENLKDTHFLVTSLVTNIYVIDKKRTFIFDIKKLYFDFFFFFLQRIAPLWGENIFG